MSESATAPGAVIWRGGEAPGMAEVDSSEDVLVLRSSGRLCGLPLASVVEILRTPLLERMPGTPETVCGFAKVRGVPVPVVDLAALLDLPGGGAHARLVVMRAGGRRVALQVDEVLGIRATASLAAIPPLLQAACQRRVQALAALDAEFLWLLNAARLAPADACEAIPPG